MLISCNEYMSWVFMLQHCWISAYMYVYVMGQQRRITAICRLTEKVKVAILSAAQCHSRTVNKLSSKSCKFCIAIYMACKSAQHSLLPISIYIYVWIYTRLSIIMTMWGCMSNAGSAAAVCHQQWGSSIGQENDSHRSVSQVGALRIMLNWLIDWLI